MVPVTESMRAVSIGAVMTGGAYITQRAREDRDFYPTPPEVTEALLQHWTPPGKVWEPCAGNGAMADVITSKTGRRVYKTDIHPLREDITKLDFLSTVGNKQAVSLSIVTNPPFNLAEKFIRHGFSLGAQTQAYLLKSTYFHAKGRKALFEEFRPSMVMPLTWRVDFMNLGRPVMEVSWFVWDSPCSEFCDYSPISKPQQEKPHERTDPRHQRNESPGNI